MVSFNRKVTVSMYDLKLLVFLVYTAIKISVVKATRNKSGCAYNLYTRCSGEMNSKGLSMLAIFC